MPHEPSDDDVETTPANPYAHALALDGTAEDASRVPEDGSADGSMTTDSHTFAVGPAVDPGDTADLPRPTPALTDTQVFARPGTNGSAAADGAVVLAGPEGEGVCPACGKYVRVSKGTCPACAMILQEYEPAHAADPLMPRQVGGGPSVGGRYHLLWQTQAGPGAEAFVVVMRREDGTQFVRVMRQSPRGRGRGADGEAPGDTVDLGGELERRHDDTLPMEGQPVAEAGVRHERDLLRQADHPRLPKVCDFLDESRTDSLVLKTARGTGLRRAWADPGRSRVVKLGWLHQILTLQEQLHRAGVVLPTLSPDMLVVTADDQVHVRDVTGIAAVGSDVVRPSWFRLSCAPEIIRDAAGADSLADSFAFGAVLLSLHLGRRLTAADFRYQGVPLPLTTLLPDAPPTLVRLLARTLQPKRSLRLPVVTTVCPDDDTDSPEKRQAADPPKSGSSGDTVERDGPPEPQDLTRRGTTLLRHFPGEGETSELRTLLAEYVESVSPPPVVCAGWTNTGMVRKRNEDTFCIERFAAGRHGGSQAATLCCVADGMGGHGAGDVASRIAVAAAAEHVRDRLDDLVHLRELPEDHPLARPQGGVNLLREAVLHAHAQVIAAGAAGQGNATMGCTLDVMLIHGLHAMVAHVGDSRVYHCINGTLRQVTRDHTLVDRMVDMGQLTAAQARVHPRRSELYQAVGAAGAMEPARYHVRLRAGDWLMMCSDGLTAHVQDDEILRLVADAPNAELAARRLVNAALVGGGSDNVTVVIAYLRDL